MSSMIIQHIDYNNLSYRKKILVDIEIEMNLQRLSEADDISYNQYNNDESNIQWLQNENSMDWQVKSRSNLRNKKFEKQKKCQFETFSPSEAIPSIDYRKGVNQYLNEMSNTIQISHSKSSDNSGQSNDSHNNEEIHAIINQVLNKRKKSSRFSSGSHDLHESPQLLYNQVHNLRKIDIVNQRLNTENEELQKKIRGLVNKIRSLNNQKFKISGNSRNKRFNSHSRSERYSNSNGYGNLQGNEYMLIQQKLKQIEELKYRLSKAEKMHMKMEMELGKLVQTKNEGQNTIKVIQSKKSISSSGSCSCVRKDKKQEGVIRNDEKKRKRKSSDWLKKDLFSPIIQCQQYSLNNSPMISLCENNLHRNSQVKLMEVLNSRKMAKQEEYQEKGTQTETRELEVSQEQEELNGEISRLEAMIKKNNDIIGRYESMLLKEII